MATLLEGFKLAMKSTPGTTVVAHDQTEQNRNKKDKNKGPISQV